MPLHDTYARITPFELLQPEEGFGDERFPAIEDEAEKRGVDLSDPERFSLLGAVGMLLQKIRGEDEDPRLIQHHGALLFHAFHFWKEGLVLFLLGTPAARYLVDTGPESGTWSPNLPAAAGYVQLPQHLFWLAGAEDAPPESLDGFFWSAPDGENLSLLVALGMRRERPGLSVIPLPGLPLPAAGEWASVNVRPDGRDFESSLPGAELENLYEVRAGAEAVKLIMRVFWYLDTFPGSVEGGKRMDDKGRGEGGEKGPRPSVLPYERIVLKGA